MNKWSKNGGRGKTKEKLESQASLKEVLSVRKVQMDSDGRDVCTSEGVQDGSNGSVVATSEIVAPQELHTVRRSEEGEEPREDDLRVRRGLKKEKWIERGIEREAWD